MIIALTLSVETIFKTRNKIGGCGCFHLQIKQGRSFQVMGKFYRTQKIRTEKLQKYKYCYR